MRMPNKKGNRGRPILLRCPALRTVADHVQTASQAHAAETKKLWEWRRYSPSNKIAHWPAVDKAAYQQLERRAARGVVGMC